MSMAIALDNSPETINNLKNISKIIDFVMSIDEFSSNVNLSVEELEKLDDWVDDMYMILTDFSLFTQEALTND